MLGVPAPSPALRPRPGPRKLGPYKFCKKGISSFASRDHTSVRGRWQRAHTHTHVHAHTQHPQPWAEAPQHPGLPHTWGSLPAVLPPTQAPLLCGAEPGPASTRMRSGTGSSVGSCPPLAEGSGCCRGRASQGQRGGQQVGTHPLGCVRGDAVRSSALEHLPPSRCKCQGCAGASGQPWAAGTGWSLEKGSLFPCSEK